MLYTPYIHYAITLYSLCWVIWPYSTLFCTCYCISPYNIYGICMAYMVFQCAQSQAVTQLHMVYMWSSMYVWGKNNANDIYCKYCNILYSMSFLWFWRKDKACMITCRRRLSCCFLLPLAVEMETSMLSLCGLYTLPEWVVFPICAV